MKLPSLSFASRLFGPLVLALSMAACGGGSGSGGTGVATGLGTMRLSLTDAPACGYDEVWVTVEKVRVHRSATADDDGAGWVDIALPAPTRVDLLTLNNGTLLPLGEEELEAGTYTQLRLVLAPNTVADPLANAVKPTGGALTAMSTPSGQSSGLKLKANLTVPEGEVADFAIDFDACKSIVKRGNSGRYNLKPVLSVIPLLGQRIEGWVDPAMVTAGTVVSVQRDGVVLRATPPLATTADLGRFILSPVPLGTYDLVITAPGRVNAVMTGVPVVAGSATVIGSPTVRFDPPLAAISHPVAGVVTGSGVTLRALQTLTSAPTTIEVAWTAADADTGAYGFVLPAAAPHSVGFALNLAAIDLVEDGVAAVRIEATDDAGTVLFEDIDPFDAAVADLDFVFP